MQNPERKEWSKSFNNETRTLDIKVLRESTLSPNRLSFMKVVLQNNNSTNFEAIIFINKGHMIFNKIQPAKKIINYISDLVNKYYS